MENILLILNIIFAILLVLLVLMQKSEGGALGIGISQDSLDQVNCPIGLDIGAESPEEIAIAVLAEILAGHKGINL